MGDRTVVALEEVLRADLPVGGELGLRPLQEAESADVDTRGSDALGDIFEEVGESKRLWICLLYTSPSPRDRS